MSRSWPIRSSQDSNGAFNLVLTWIQRAKPARVAYSIASLCITTHGPYDRNMPVLLDQETQQIPLPSHLIHPIVRSSSDEVNGRNHCLRPSARRNMRDDKLTAGLARSTAWHDFNLELAILEPIFPRLLVVLLLSTQAVRSRQASNDTSGITDASYPSSK